MREIALNRKQIDNILSGGYLIAFSQIYRPNEDIMARLKETDLETTAIYLRPGKNFEDNLRLSFRRIS